MGTNNKQRRAAKQRKRARRQGGRPGGSPDGASAGTTYDLTAAYALAQVHVSDLVQARLGHDLGDAELLRHVEVIARAIFPAPSQIVGAVVRDSLVDVVARVRRGGWTVPEIEELVRRTHESWLPRIGTAHGVRDADGPGSSVVTAQELGLLMLLCDLPLLDADAVARARDRHVPRSHPKWQQARSLLAKAESTDFGPEADALVAKAQQLISKYALERLAGAAESPVTPEPTTRRIWLDRPYLAAKAGLVAEVARANRCRSAFAERHQFSIVVGDDSDLDAVELLATSLLLQADTAMFVHGRASARGRSRSFRRSFLMAYATRIGERLREADEAAVTETPAALPVLRDHASRVTATFEAMVPTAPAKSVAVTDESGWVAGTAAADLARLDVRDGLGRSV